MTKNTFDQKKIDFIIIGCDKCGTTDLANILNRTNKFCLPVHETSIFEDKDNINEISDFLSKLIIEKKINGIKRPSYINYEHVLKKIYMYNKNIKLILIIRNPVERFISHFLEFIRYDFIEFKNINRNMIKLLNENKTFINSYPRSKEILISSNYIKNLKKLLKIFPRENLLLMDFEEIKNLKFRRKINNFFKTNCKLSQDKIINRSENSYFGIFLERVRNKIRYKKTKLRVYSKKLNIFEKIILKIIETILKYNVFKKKIYISESVKQNIFNKYNRQYTKTFKL